MFEFIDLYCFRCLLLPTDSYEEPNFTPPKIADGIMRKDTKTAKITEIEIARNKQISKKRYIVEQYFGLSHLYDGAKRARFTTIMKNTWDVMCSQMTSNMFRGTKLLPST